MTTKKKPKLYTNTGRVKKPAAPKAKDTSVKRTIENLHERAVRFEKHANYWEKLYDSWVADLASRTIKLWFGWSLVRPDKPFK